MLTNDDDAPRLPRVVQTVHGVSYRPNGVALAGGAAWVSSSDKVKLVRVDAPTGRIADGPRVGSGVQDMVTDGTSLWVAARRTRRVTEIDARSGRVVRSLGFRGEPLRLALGAGSLWVATSSVAPDANLLIRYDLAGRELRRWPMAHGVLSLAADAHTLWIAERTAATVQRFDPETGQLALLGKVAAPASSLYLGAGYLWATLLAKDNIARIDPRGGVATSAACHQPTHVVAAGGRIYVACDTDHTVVRFDPRTSKRVGQIEVPLNP
jgi:streptogramin lyase